MYHILEEDYCKCREYGTPMFKDVYEDVDDFISAMKTSGIPTKVSDASLNTIYYLLYARYGVSHIATTNTAQFAYQVASTIFSFGPNWEKQLEIQDRLRGLTEAELLQSATTINNFAVNPGTAPAVDAFDPLPYINQQSGSRNTRGTIDGYAALLSLLQDDITSSFIEQFATFFMTFVGWDDEDYATEGQTKTITPTKSTQYIQADEGYYLDTVVVNPIPSNYIVPSGTRSITANGNYNIRNYEAVKVNVPEPDLDTLNVVENGTYTGAYDTVNVNVPEITLTTKNITANGTYNAPANTGFNVINVNVESEGGEVDFSKYETYGTDLGLIYQIVVSGSRIKNLTTYVNGDESYDAWNPPSEDTLITAAQDTVITTAGTTGSQDLNNRTFAWLYIKREGTGSDSRLYGCEVESGGGTINVGPTGNWAIGKTYESASISLQNGDVPSNSVLYDNFYAQMSDHNGYIQIFFIGGNTGNSYALSFSIDSNVMNCWVEDGSGNRTTIIENGTAQSSIWMPSEPITICGCMFGGMLNDGTSYGSAEFWTRMAAALDTIFYIG